MKSLNLLHQQHTNSEESDQRDVHSAQDVQPSAKFAITFVFFVSGLCWKLFNYTMSARLERAECLNKYRVNRGNAIKRVSEKKRRQNKNKSKRKQNSTNEWNFNYGLNDDYGGTGVNSDCKWQLETVSGILTHCQRVARRMPLLYSYCHNETQTNAVTAGRYNNNKSFIVCVRPFVSVVGLSRWCYGFACLISLHLHTGRAQSKNYYLLTTTSKIKMKRKN